LTPEGFNAVMLRSGFTQNITINPKIRRKVMKNPLDSLWGTIISGLVLTLVLYVIVDKIFVSMGG
jgi:hypothetical protein